MRSIPLLTGEPSPVEAEYPLLPDPGCERCPRRLGVRVVCAPPVTVERPGRRLLVVFGEPTPDEDAPGRAFRGWERHAVRRAIESLWDGRVVYDYAVRCAAPLGEAKVPDSVQDCRPYLAHTLAQGFDRVLVFGRAASRSVLGRDYYHVSARRAYGYLTRQRIPVYLLPDYAEVRPNRVFTRWFDNDLRVALTREPPFRPPWEGKALLCYDADDVDEALRDLLAMDDPRAGFDCETFGHLHGDDFRMLTIAVAPRGRDDVYVFTAEALADDGAVEVVRRMFQHPAIRWEGANGKYDIHALWTWKRIDLRNYASDSQVLSRIQESEAAADLETAAEKVGMGGHKSELQDQLARAETRALQEARLDLDKRTGRRSRKRLGVQQDLFAAPGAGLFDRVSTVNLQGIVDKVRDESIKRYAFALVNPEVLYRYCALDTLAATRLCQLYERRLRADEGLDRVWDKLVRAGTRALVQLEREGFPVDRAMLDEAERFFAAEVAAVEPLLEEQGVDPASAPDLARFLYEELKLPVPGLTEKGQPSTDDAALKTLERHHPAVVLIRKYRLAKKCLDYAQLHRRCLRYDDRIHCTLTPDVARTGRLSSREPNLQNILAAEDLWSKDWHARLEAQYAYRIRDYFRPIDGWILCKYDYDQLEYRVAAWLSGDPEMKKILDAGIDFHTGTTMLISEMVWGVEYNDPKTVSKDHRKFSKVMNFATIFGMGIKNIAAALGCSVDTASEVKNAIMGKFKKLEDLIRYCHAEGERTGVTYTYVVEYDPDSGRWRTRRFRRRQIPYIGDRSHPRWSNAKNSSFNCLDAETEALTRRGWVRGFDLTDDDVLLTKNAKTGVLEWHKVTQVKKWPEYEGQLYEFKSKTFSAVTTPGHRWLIRNKSTGQDECRTAERLSYYGDHRIHRTGEWRGPEGPWSDDFLEICGWFLTDGNVQMAHRGPAKVRARDGYTYPLPRPQVRLCQSQRGNPDKVKRIDALLDRTGVPYRRMVTGGTGQVWWHLQRGGVSEKLDRLFPGRTLTPEFIGSLSHRQANHLIDVMLLGDGHTGNSGERRFACRDRNRADMFQLLCVMAGIATNATWRDMSMYTPRSPKMANVPKMTGVFCITLLRRSTAQVLPGHRRVFHGKQPVWCPVVPNTYFVARREGKVYITGNSRIQGTGSDICLAALIRIQKWIEREGLQDKLRVLVTIHDALFFLVRRDFVREAAAKIKQEMEYGDYGGVPITVSGDIGMSWAAMLPYSDELADIVARGGFWAEYERVMAKKAAQAAGD